MRRELFDLHGRIEETHWWFTGRREILTATIKQLVPNTTPGRLIVDVGCGTGANAAAIAAAGYTCLGIDTDLPAIEQARARFPGTEFLHGFAPQDIGTERMLSADLVLATDVIEHIADDFKFVSVLLAAMRPGAFLLLTVPADMALWSPHDESFGHYRRYDAGRLRQVWKDLPVRPVLCSYFNSRMYPLARWVRERTRRSRKSAGEGGSDFFLPPAPVNALLRSLFAGEMSGLSQAMSRVGASDTAETDPYHRGVSLIAVLERSPGTVTPRSRDTVGIVAPDPHDPEAAIAAASRN